MFKKTIISAILFSSFSTHAIVPVTTDEKVKQGFSGNASVTFQYESLDGYKSELEFDSNVVLNYRYSNDIFKFIYEGNLKENNSNKIDNDNFIHLRHVRLEFWNQLNLESFVQYEEDDFEDLASRKLIGSGLGKTGHINYFKNIDISIGYFAGVMLELEKSITNSNLNSSSIRATSSASANFEFKDFNSMAYLNLYYQPKLDSFSDYRAIGAVGFETEAFSNVLIGLRYQFEHDSESFNNSYNRKENLKTYIKYKF